MSYILVLGAGSKNNILTEISKNRVKESLNYSNKNNTHNKNDSNKHTSNNIIIFSGNYSIYAGGSKKSEAELMLAYAKSLGFKGNYILEKKSTTTLSNLLNSQKIIGNKNDVIIITSKFHKSRVNYLCKRIFKKNIKIIITKDNPLHKQVLEKIFFIVDFIRTLTF